MKKIFNLIIISILILTNCSIVFADTDKSDGGTHIDTSEHFHDSDKLEKEEIVINSKDGKKMRKLIDNGNYVVVNSIDEIYKIEGYENILFKVKTIQTRGSATCYNCGNPGLGLNTYVFLKSAGSPLCTYYPGCVDKMDEWREYVYESCTYCSLENVANARRWWIVICGLDPMSGGTSWNVVVGASMDDGYDSHQCLNPAQHIPFYESTMIY